VFKWLVFGSAAGLLLGILASRVLAFIVYQATPRDPLVLAGVVLFMALLGLLATWIPAQRALSLDPMTLLREEWTGFIEAASAHSAGRNSALQIVAREKRAFMSFGTVDQIIEGPESIGAFLVESKTEVAHNDSKSS
jgi:hypothetical protein